MSVDKPIMSLADAPVVSLAHADCYAVKMQRLAHPLGARLIGSNISTVPKGKAAFPLHHHYANEEHFFILSGVGLLRVGNSSFPVKAHDYVFSAPGGPEQAHQLINTGDEDLIYLAISSNVLPEVVGYPDSQKTGVRIAPFEAENSRFLLLDSSRNEVDYWHDEDGAAVKLLAGKSNAQK